MINALLFILGFFLLLATILDLKYRSVPSVLLTALIFVSLIMRPENLVFGVLAVILLLIVKEFSNEEIGMADFKVIAVMGLLIPTIQGFFNFSIVLMIFQFAYIGLLRLFLKLDGEIPFLPCLFCIYVGLAISGVLI